MINPQEALLQEARAFQQSEAFAPYRKLRQVAEHRLARLMQPADNEVAPYLDAHRHPPEHLHFPWHHPQL
jgi:hypothetical protein